MRAPGGAGAGPRLRVLSYNVHGQRDDRSALAAVVREVAPDVVIVQEAPRRFRWRYGCAALADAFGLVVAAGGLPSLGNLLLTDLRVRVHDTWCWRYPLTPGRHLRGAAFALCSVGGGHASPGGATFVVGGSHLSTDPAERPGQAALLRRMMAEYDVPVILGVDLNEDPGGVAWRIVAGAMTDAAMTDAAVATGRSGRFTYPGTRPRNRLDAILVDPRIAVLDCDVIDNPRSRRASDHLPVLADVSLPTTG